MSRVATPSSSMQRETLPHRAYIGLGSNLNEPHRQLQQARLALQSLADCALLAFSSCYLSKPLGNLPQPDYCNAVALLATALKPDDLLQRLQALEQAQGRERHLRWSSRTLDLDLLLYDDAVINDERLTVPHYALCERPFVVFPLLEITPDLHLPDGRPLSGIAASLDHNTLIKL